MLKILGSSQGVGTWALLMSFELPVLTAPTPTPLRHLELVRAYCPSTPASLRAPALWTGRPGRENPV